jgi:hypothetical protein
MFSNAWKRISVEVEGIGVDDEEDAGEAEGVEGWRLEGDEWGRLGKIESDSDLLTCWTFFVTLPFMEGAGGVYE